MVSKGSLALAGNVPSDGVTIKILLGGNLKNNVDIKYFTKNMGMKEKKHVKSKEPWWERRSKNNIIALRGNINLLERERKVGVKKRGKTRQLEQKYNMKKKKFQNCQ